MAKYPYRFIILTDDENRVSPIIPTSLVPLGHHPIICILIQTLLEVVEDCKITLIVRPEHQDLYQREMRRWFREKDIDMAATLGPKSSQSLHSYVAGLDDQGSVIILQSDYPLLSKTTLDEFLFHSSEEDFAVLGTIRTRWNEDRGLIHLDVERERVVGIDPAKPFTRAGYIPCCKAPVQLLKTLLPQADEYFEIFNLAPNKPLYIGVQSFPGQIDNLCIASPQDKVFAENRFMEKQNADFLSHCYRVWNKCKQMEDRLDALEAIIKQK